MIKTIIKVGNSQGIIFDAALLDLARLKVGDELNVVLHEGGTITLTPLHAPVATGQVSAVIRKTVNDYRKTLKRLA